MSSLRLGLEESERAYNPWKEVKVGFRFAIMSALRADHRLVADQDAAPGVQAFIDFLAEMTGRFPNDVLVD
jgi:hypothetical protein